MPDWLAALGELEALVALGTFAAEHPHAVYPDFLEGPCRVEARGLTHPLLDSATAVANDIVLGGDAPHLLLVSGSNMSGKSTWLRTVGINVVLAQAGAPVLALELRLTPLRPAGTLRVQDSLETGRRASSPRSRSCVRSSTSPGRVRRPHPGQARSSCWMNCSPAPTPTTGASARKACFAAC